MRKPKIRNKYNLKPKDIEKMRVIDKDRIHQEPFWRNDVIKAWCLSDTIGTADDIRYGTDSSYWIGIYDEDAKHYAGKDSSDYSHYYLFF